MPKFDTSRTALLAMDFLNDIVDPKGKFGVQAFAGHVEQKHAIENAARAVAAARSKSLPVIHVVVAFPEGHPGLNMSAQLFAGIKQANALVQGTWGADFHPALKPAPDELVVTKQTVSAFAGTDLDKSLRPRGITTLVLTGVATNFVIDGTARDAVDRGYAVVILEDCCASFNEELHISALQVLSHLAQVSSADEFLSAL